MKAVIGTYSHAHEIGVIVKLDIIDENDFSVTELEELSDEVAMHVAGLNQYEGIMSEPQLMEILESQWIKNPILSLHDHIKLTSHDIQLSYVIRVKGNWDGTYPSNVRTRK